jgi:flavin reductase (DIM6/NTAB) family NADH-FMN oxidoreductase RutF
MDASYRRSMINSLAGFRQAVLVGTISDQGVTNVAIFNSLIHLGANPPLFGLISRPDSVSRDTLRNILNTGYYTLNFVSTDMAQIAHQTSARYDVSEFEALKLQQFYSENFLAPFIQDAVVKIGLKFEEKLDITINGTVMIIGSIDRIIVHDDIICNDGFMDLSRLNVLVSCGLDAYYSVNPISRFAYAKPTHMATKLDFN